jgi:uncharacterized protein
MIVKVSRELKKIVIRKGKKDFIGKGGIIGQKCATRLLGHAKVETMKTHNLWRWILATIVVLVLFFFSRIVFFSTEWLWYKTNGYESVFSKMLWSRILLGIVVGVAFFLFLGINLLLVRRLRGKMPYFIGNNVLHLPSLRNLEPYVDKIALACIILISSLAGFQASLQWDLVLKATHGTSFGVADPLYFRDVSFYVFSLPLLQYFYSTTFFLLITALLFALALYLAERSIIYSPQEFFISPKSKAHILVIVSLLFLVKAWGYHLSTYDLLHSARGVVYGATYTDIYAQLPFLRIAIFASIICALAILRDIFTKGWKSTIVCIGALLVLSLGGGVVYPGIIQKFVVAPNELNLESPFIARNIEFTRKAFALDKIQEREFSAQEDLSWRDIEKNDATIKNVRLWDHRPLLETYSELQEIRTYYNFFDVDNDRYTINGDYVQTMLSPRELSYDKLPDRKWINQTFIYTHGYGCCLGPVNKVTDDGLPEFFIKDIPPESKVDMKLERPEIYFGELSDSYCIVNSGMKEFDYPFGEKNVYCEYRGTGGMLIDSFLRRFLIALRFHEGKILLSSDIRKTSRIMFYRNINERIRKATPLIYYDQDPYLIISEGKLYWICDGYTVTPNYPYSQPIPQVGNYLRNSVKAVIDAYNGTMRFYITDDSDPIITTYSNIFPGVFEPIKSMPRDIRAHIRYPGGLFDVQAHMFATYHMTDPQVFYNKEDLWKIPKRMEAKTEVDMKPYYTILKFPQPEGTKEEFILMIPFTPARKANMIAWMAARCDEPNYGKLLAYTFPKDKLIYGPQQIEARIDQDPEISKQLSLWGQGGSDVIRGSLLVIPIEDSLLYIEPLYLAADKGKLPQLKRVIAVYGSMVAMENNLERALQKVLTAGMGATIPKSPNAPVTLRHDENLKTLIMKANESFEKARGYQREENWAGYGEEMKKLREILEELKSAWGKETAPDREKTPEKSSKTVKAKP